MKGGIFMNMCTLGVPSVTFAQKAKAYLWDKGYNCEIIRTKNSCGYSIRVNAECAAVKKMLDEKNIPYKEKSISSW